MEMEREEEEETESVSDVLRDRFRLSTISIAEAEGTFFHLFSFFFFSIWKLKFRNVSFCFSAKRNGMEISEPIVACISDLAFKYAGSFYSRSYVIIAF